MKVKNLKNSIYLIVYFSIFCILSFESLPAQIPAFPGAEGQGRGSVGGRGGVVIEVTNLNDTGPGSLRAACSTIGPRTIVFRIGGIITLITEIQITEPYIYIAAQTAPGDGIVLKIIRSRFLHTMLLFVD